MTKQQDTTGAIPVSVNTFGRLTEWIEKEAEQIRRDLRCMFDDLVEKEALAQNRDYLTGPIDSLNFFDDHLGKSKAHENKAIFLASHDLVHQIRNKVSDRFAEITQSHVQEIARTYPDLELRGSIYYKDDIFVSLFKDGLKIYSQKDLKTGHHGNAFTFGREQIDQSYPGVIARIDEIGNAFRFCQEHDAFSVNPHMMTVMTLIAPDGTMESPRFPQEHPQEQHIARNRADDGFDGESLEDVYREFIDSFGMTEAFEKFRKERVQREHDMDAELSKGPG